MSNFISDIFVGIVKLFQGISEAGAPTLTNITNETVGQQLLTSQLSATIILLGIGAIGYHYIKSRLGQFILAIVIGATIFSIFTVTPNDILPLGGSPATGSIAPIRVG